MEVALVWMVGVAILAIVLPRYVLDFVLSTATACAVRVFVRMDGVTMIVRASSTRPVRVTLKAMKAWLVSIAAITESVLADYAVVNQVGVAMAVVAARIFVLDFVRIMVRVNVECAIAPSDGEATIAVVTCFLSVLVRMAV